MEPKIAAQIEALRARADTTLFTVLLAAFKTLMHRYTGQDDLIVGSRALGRTRPEFETMAGLLANPIAIRSRIEGGRSFADYLGVVDRAVSGALKHQDYPFALLVEKLGVPETPDRSPVFQVDFTMEHAATRHREGFANSLVNTPGQSFHFGGVDIETIGIARNRALHDLTLEVEEFEGLIYGIIDYDADLFDAATIERLAEDYRAVLRAVAADPDRLLADPQLAAE